MGKGTLAADLVRGGVSCLGAAVKLTKRLDRNARDSSETRDTPGLRKTGGGLGWAGGDPKS